eukprot:2167282-Pyramimonas_sp.AAC.1
MLLSGVLATWRLMYNKRVEVRAQKEKNISLQQQLKTEGALVAVDVPSKGKGKRKKDAAVHPEPSDQPSGAARIHPEPSDSPSGSATLRIHPAPSDPSSSALTTRHERHEHEEISRHHDNHDDE